MCHHIYRLLQLPPAWWHTSSNYPSRLWQVVSPSCYYVDASSPNKPKKISLIAFIVNPFKGGAPPLHFIKCQEYALNSWRETPCKKRQYFLRCSAGPCMALEWVVTPEYQIKNTTGIWTLCTLRHVCRKKLLQPGSCQRLIDFVKKKKELKKKAPASVLMKTSAWIQSRIKFG